jgi:hypothetical protein
MRQAVSNYKEKREKGFEQVLLLPSVDTIMTGVT